MYKEPGTTARLLPPAAKKLTEPRTRPTMRDVARLAGGVHPSTVSLALRNHPGISEATRKRVRAAARKLGYRPDPLLDAFNTHRLEVLPHKALPVIAFVADFDSRQTLERAPHHGMLWSGARAAAETLHCQIELFLIGKTQLTPERLHSILRARGISSVVIGGCRAHTPRLAFHWPDYSAVVIESDHLQLPLYSVASDRRQAARLAFRKLREKGYRRIGLATAGGGELRLDALYQAGFFLEQMRSPDTAPVPPLDFSAATSEAVIRDWIREHQLEAVIGQGPELAVRLAEVAHAVPRPIAYAALEAPSGSAEIAGIVPDYSRVGAQAVEQVIGLMRSNQRGLPATSSCTLVPVAWRDGSSAPAKH